MPVRHDVHRTRCAALLTDEAPADRRPGQDLRQGVQSDINHTSIALAGRTLDSRSRYRRRAILPARREGICVSIEMVVAAKPWPMIS